MTCCSFSNVNFRPNLPTAVWFQAQARYGYQNMFTKTRLLKHVY
ncbi:hypothetical protein CZ787_13090 [Halomonas citrativorans]|uniref:Uncharacterized protein n=1 Tax=Halomonas citrativorans TaxID=2742612 RepID=A0A1R4I2Q4_9GAMM|nr:hypothetical protein CZ787_13090 [Halomonas citrativorans]